ERGQRRDRLARQVHVGTRPGQRDGYPGEPALGDVAARAVRLEARSAPLGQQGDHHISGVVPVSRVLRSRVAETGDDPAFCGQPAYSSSLPLAAEPPASASTDALPTASGTSPSASSPVSGSSSPPCCAMTCRTSVSGSTCKVTPSG